MIRELNFSFITDDDGNSFHNFQKFTEPIVQALQSLGVNAELTGVTIFKLDKRKSQGMLWLKLKIECLVMVR